MKGRAPIRRTLKYLEAGKLVLQENIRIFSLNYNTFNDNHNGAKELVFWNIPQIQYKNPSVQVITFKNMTPTPFVRCYYDNGKQVLVDIDNRNRTEILDHLIKIFGKTKQQLSMEEFLAEKKDNPANFGFGCDRHCICEILGQVPCPGTVPLPTHMRGKTKYQQF